MVRELLLRASARILLADATTAHCIALTRGKQPTFRKLLKALPWQGWRTLRL